MSAVWPMMAQPTSRDDAAEGLGVGLGRVAGDGVELVERAAGVAEAAAGDHRHEGAAGGERRGEHEADVVADAAGRVLVDHRPGEVPGRGPCRESRMASVSATRSSVSMPRKKTAMAKAATWPSVIDARGQALDHEADLGGGRAAAVALAGDDLLREHQ